MKHEKIKFLLIIFVLILAGISPNIFPDAQAGYSDLSSLALHFLIPSIGLLFLLLLIVYFLKYADLKKQILTGIIAGLIGTIGLEIIREIGFRIGFMPGDLPKLMGVLLLNRFAEGPDFWSNLAGWSYHFWNGAAFGIIFSLLFGRGKIAWAVIYGVVIGIVFMISPVTRALGIGAFGLQFKDGYRFLSTVLLAHIAYGSILGIIIFKLNYDLPNIVVRIKNAF